LVHRTALLAMSRMTTRERDLRALRYLEIECELQEMMVNRRK
jgi:hypothetical protein